MFPDQPVAASATEPPQASPLRAESGDLAVRDLDADEPSDQEVRRPPAGDSQPQDQPDQDPGGTSTPHVQIVVPATEFFVGDAIPIVVAISSATDVGHVPFHLTFDPGVLRFEYGEEGGFLASDGHQTAFFAAATSDGSSVVVGLSRLGRVGGIDGGGELCLLHFTAVGPGNANVGFSRAKVRDSANHIVPSVFQPATLVVLE